MVDGAVVSHHHHSCVSLLFAPFDEPRAQYLKLVVRDAIDPVPPEAGISRLDNLELGIVSVHRERIENLVTRQGDRRRSRIEHPRTDQRSDAATRLVGTSQDECAFDGPPRRAHDEQVVVRDSEVESQVGQLRAPYWSQPGVLDIQATGEVQPVLALPMSNEQKVHRRLR